MIGFRFHETMEGSVRLPDERFDRPFRFRLEVRGARLASMLSTAAAAATGRVRIDGIARDTEMKGTISISPIRGRQVRYELSFAGDDGHPYQFEGTKTIRYTRWRTSWTTLRGHLRDVAGNDVGGAVLRFRLRPGLGDFVRGFRLVTDNVARGSSAKPLVAGGAK